jgi:hypothetical protein
VNCFHIIEPSSLLIKFSIGLDIVDKKLSLVNVVSDYDGIKVDIEGLGVEISFAKNIFKSQMIEHILKAV